MKRINLNELTLNNRGRWPLSIQTGSILGLCVFIFLFGYWFFVKGNFVALNELKQHEQSLKNKFEMKQHQIVNIKHYRGQVSILRYRFSRIRSQFLVKNKMAGLLDEISKTGITSGLKFELFAPQAEIKRDFYVELPVKMIVAGSFSRLALFLSHLAQMNQPVTIHEFLVKRKKQAVSGNELEMMVIAKIYREKTE